MICVIEMQCKKRKIKANNVQQAHEQQTNRKLNSKVEIFFYRELN